MNCRRARLRWDRRTRFAAALRRLCRHGKRMHVIARSGRTFYLQWRLKRAPQDTPRLMQLRFGIAARAIEHGGNLAMFESLHVVKVKDGAITGSQGSNCAIDGQAVNGAGLS